MIDKVDDNGTIYNYSYDKLGNITEIRKNNALTNKYYYDEYSELIKEDDLVRNETKHYVYDNYGNILSKKTYTYNTTNLIKEDKYEYTNSNWQDLLTKFNNESITYDTIGNPLTIGNKTLTWMNGRELSTYSDGTNNISYKYNLDGIRTSKIVNGIETKYYLEGNSIIFEDRNGTMIYYIYNGDELLGFVYNNNTYYYHKNIFGDIIGILDSNYNEIVLYEYDSWGALVNIIDNSNINLGTINPFRYRSYYYDTETQLYYLNSRYYNPQIGRFINADSMITGQGFNGNNVFVYCDNMPIGFKDENGNFIVSTFCIGALAGGIVQIISNKISGNKWNENVISASLISGTAALVGGFVTVVLKSLVGVGTLTLADAYISGIVVSNVLSTQMYYQFGLSSDEDTLVSYALAIPLGVLSAPVSMEIDKLDGVGNYASNTIKSVSDGIINNGTANIIKNNSPKKTNKSNNNTNSNKRTITTNSTTNSTTNKRSIPIVNKTFVGPPEPIPKLKPLPGPFDTLKRVCPVW